MLSESHAPAKNEERPKSNSSGQPSSVTPVTSMQNLHTKANLRDRFDQQEQNLQEDEDVDKIEDSQEE